MARQKPSDQLATLLKQQADLTAKLKEAKTKADMEAKETQRHKNECAGALALKELSGNPSGAFASALREGFGQGAFRSASAAKGDQGDGRIRGASRIILHVRALIAAPHPG